MVRQTIVPLTLFLACSTVRADPKAQTAQAAQAKGRTLVERMVSKVGSMQKLHALRDVEYTYIYRRPDGAMDLSLERYRFDGELSWGRYIVHEVFVSPGVDGDVVQSFDGKTARVTVNGEPSEDPKERERAAFGRKTTYYWFAMMPKLLDPGTHHEHQGTRNVDGVEYDLVNVTFGKSVGETTDRYLLYVNPNTGLVDQFLFTVMDFNVTQPYLMKVEYDEVDGILLPARRRYVASDWEGKVASDKWVHEIMTGIRFDNGFSARDFAP